MILVRDMKKGNVLCLNAQSEIQILNRTLHTLLVSRSECARDKPFLLTIISYFKK